MAACRKEQSGPRKVQSAFELDLDELPVLAFETLNALLAQRYPVFL